MNNGVDSEQYLVEKLLATGERLSLAGQNEEALNMFDEVLKIDPENILALQSKGPALNDLERYEEAAVNSYELLRIDPNNIVALNSKGRALRHLNRPAEAIEALDKALGIDPKFVHAINNKATVLEDLEQYQKAIDLYDQALAIDPVYAFAQSNKVRTLGKMQRSTREMGTEEYGGENFVAEDLSWVPWDEVVAEPEFETSVIQGNGDVIPDTPVNKSFTSPNKTMREYAQHYYNLGLNVTCVSDVKNEINSKAENFYLKAPNHQWEDLWSRRQTPDEFNNYQWSIATGFGLITGFNNLLAIDMDNCSYELVTQTLAVLGLPSDYEWVVLSGSKQGYHIYVFVNDLLNNFPKIAVVRLFPKELYSTLVSKVELLIRLHSILPPPLEYS